MKTFAKTFKTKELGQILIQAIKKGENCPDEPSHLCLSFLHPEEGSKCILKDTMRYKEALKVVRKGLKQRVLEIALDTLMDINKERDEYAQLCEDLKRRRENGDL